MLIKNIEEVRKVLPINISLDFNNFKPDLERAEEDEVIPLLGQALYDDLQVKYDLAALTPMETKLLAYCHRIVCNLAYTYFLPKVQVQTSSQGVHIVSTDTKKTAFQWQIRDMLDSHTNAAYDAVEKAMAFLDANIPDFPDWALSNTYTAISGLLIANIKELENCISIRASFRLFRELIPQIRKWDAELRKTADPNTLTPAALASAKRYVAYMSVAEVRGLSIDNGGLFLRKASSNDVQGKESPALAEVLAFQNKLKADAKAELEIVNKEVNPTSNSVFKNGDTKYFAI